MMLADEKTKGMGIDEVGYHDWPRLRTEAPKGLRERLERLCWRRTMKMDEHGIAQNKIINLIELIESDEECRKKTIVIFNLRLDDREIGESFERALIVNKLVNESLKKGVRYRVINKNEDPSFDFAVFIDTKKIKNERFIFKMFHKILRWRN